MLKELPEEEFGPGIDIREYSILDNPSLPLEVNSCQSRQNLNQCILLSCYIFFFAEVMLGFLSSGEKVVARCSPL